jgi:hypothetical protein
VKETKTLRIFSAKVFCFTFLHQPVSIYFRWSNTDICAKFTGPKKFFSAQLSV